MLSKKTVMNKCESQAVEIAKLRARLEARQGNLKRAIHSRDTVYAALDAAARRAGIHKNYAKNGEPFDTEQFISDLLTWDRERLKAEALKRLESADFA